jgi:hypothetical protein
MNARLNSANGHMQERIEKKKKKVKNLSEWLVGELRDT